MSDEHEHDIDNELGRQSREEEADDAMFDGAEAASQASPIPIVLCGIYRLKIDKNVTVKGKLISASRNNGTRHDGSRMHGVGSGTLAVAMFGRVWHVRVALDELLPDDESSKG